MILKKSGFVPGVAVELNAAQPEIYDSPFGVIKWKSSL